MQASLEDWADIQFKNVHFTDMAEDVVVGRQSGSINIGDLELEEN